MASVDVTMTYDDDEGTAADIGETLCLFASFGVLKPEKLTLDIFLAVGDEETPIPPGMGVGLMGVLTDLPLGVKAGLKLTLSRDKYGAPDIVGKALVQLAQSGTILLSKVTLSIPVRDESEADRLIADLEVHLAERPGSVDVEFEKVVPGSFRRGRFPRRTPIDEALANLTDLTERRGVESVTLTHIAPGQEPRTVTLTPETRRRAEQALKNAAGE